MSLSHKNVAIIGIGCTKQGKFGKTPTELMIEALLEAITDANILKEEIEGIITSIPLAIPKMDQAAYLAQKMNLVPKKNNGKMACITIGTGGASGVTGILEGTFLINSGSAEVVAIILGDSFLSLTQEEMFKIYANYLDDPSEPDPSKPVIPRLYDRIARWYLKEYKSKREYFAMVSAFMIKQASHHPKALFYKKELSIEEILQSSNVAEVTTKLECAKRADGAGAVILSSLNFMKRNNLEDRAITILGGALQSKMYHVPTDIDQINENFFCIKSAFNMAMKEAELKSVNEIDFFGIYDCFPIMVIKTIEDIGLAPPGKGGEYIEKIYKESFYKPVGFNTHGGLQAFGAPASVPAIYNVIEAVEQIRGEAKGIQVPNVKRALIFGNGGIACHSAFLIIEKYNNNHLYKRKSKF